MLRVVLLALCAVAVAAKYRNEFVEKPGVRGSLEHKLPLPHTYVDGKSLPTDWDWRNINGSSYVTKSLNQHLPQYCGSCWAHGALSSFADRIKIARKGRGADINLAIQYILNCGDAGSCHGGDHLATYAFIKKAGQVPYDTCLPYEACSSESTEGSCATAKRDYSCSPINTCRTCSTFSDMGGVCNPIDYYPNATIAEYGSVGTTVEEIKAEIYARGPIACGINAEPVLQYTGGVFDDPTQDQGINHIISVVGWGFDTSVSKEYWIVRNSWGEYWGELGYVRIATGKNQIGIESYCAWATPDTWTEFNYPCFEDGSNCDQGRFISNRYVDPALTMISSGRRAASALTPQ